CAGFRAIGKLWRWRQVRVGLCQQRVASRGLMGSNMNLKRQILSYFTLIVTAVAAVGLAAISAPVRAQQAAVAIDNDDIGGVVRGPAGPEAGVWVIAETTELPTKFTKIVVTDDQGRFVIPDLPRADY